MLILARHIGETLIIGDNVSVTVLKKKGSFIQIGVNAPKNVTILRSELIKHPPSPLEKNHVEE